MARTPEPPDPRDWSPLTSEPGETNTPMGQVRGVGAAVRGLRNSDPRVRAYRRSMWRTAGWLLVAGAVLTAAIAALAAVL
jgi:hypothetical protein